MCLGSVRHRTSKDNHVSRTKRKKPHNFVHRKTSTTNTITLCVYEKNKPIYLHTTGCFLCISSILKLRINFRLKKVSIETCITELQEDKDS